MKPHNTNPTQGRDMIRVDGAYLYEFGERVRAISRLPAGEMKRIDLYAYLFGVTQAIEDFLTKSVFSPGLKTLHNSAQILLNALGELLPEPLPDELTWTDAIPTWQVDALKTSAREFEVVLIAELQSAALYHVHPKGGYDTLALIDNGELIFPSGMAAKVPDAMPDAKAACRCIAFELPTASAFHLHRANEAVLRVYWDKVTNGQPHPKQQNIGVYLNELDKLNAGKKEVREHLKSIKDFHRNPIMHPDQSIDTIDQAIDLLAAIRSSIGYMLREIS